MSAAVEDLVHGRRDDPGRRSSGQVFWQWFALGALLAGWIAEATMCALRGF